MAEEKSTDTREPGATPIGPGEPVEHVALSQMGATFAERKAAREGGKAPKAAEVRETTTFADRRAAAKAVQSGDSEVEDKAVKKPQKRAAKKN